MNRKILPLLLVLLLVSCSPLTTIEAENQNISTDVLGRFAQLALDCVHREYPNKIAHVLNADTDSQPPRQLTPAFYGCFDWHSAVHGHWLLARLSKLYPEADFTPSARAALARSLTADNIREELNYLSAPGRYSFERPYGLAWLLQLAAELKSWDDPQAQTWYRNLQPLEALVIQRIEEWVPKLAYPIRGGEHFQTAFAFALFLDWAKASKNDSFADLIKQHSLRLYGADKDCPLAYEPSGHDFLSPCLAEADLMRRVLQGPKYRAWLREFLPRLSHPRAVLLHPAVVVDPTDGKLAHLDGLNLSRAWALEGLASVLDNTDRRKARLLQSARAHRDSGLASVTGEHYEGGHWLASFATYLVTRRGIE